MTAKSSAKLDESAKGVFVIAATPFTDDGALDLHSVDSLTDFYLRCGVHGFTLLGMMGEAHKLTAEESLEVVKRVVARAGTKQVIAGVSHAGLENVRRLAHEAMIAGASGVMVAPTAGLKGDEGLYSYFAQVFAALGRDIPVVYQDYPQAAGVYLAPSLFERLVDHFPQLVMLKHEDNPGLAKLSRIREGQRNGHRRVAILVGNGGLYYPQEMRRGADGAMTGFAWPEMLVDVYELFAAGKAEQAEDLFDIYLPLVRHEVQPAIGLALRKEVLFRRGAIKSPRQRAPGSSLSAIDRAELDALIGRMERRLAAAGRGHRVAAE
jgi:4-hydroxy-tetrahydrodipicolinate synthase